MTRAPGKGWAAVRDKAGKENGSEYGQSRELLGRANSVPGLEPWKVLEPRRREP